MSARFQAQKWDMRVCAGNGSPMCILCAHAHPAPTLRSVRQKGGGERDDFYVAVVCLHEIMCTEVGYIDLGQRKTGAKWWGWPALYLYVPVGATYGPFALPTFSRGGNSEPSGFCAPGKARLTDSDQVVGAGQIAADTAWACGATGSVHGRRGGQGGRQMRSASQGH